MESMSNESQQNIFKVFLWKNWRFIYYNKIHILIFLIAECVILGLYFGITLPSKDKEYSEENIYTLKHLDELKSTISFQDEDNIFYTPKNEFLDNLMEDLRIELGLTVDKVVGLENVRDVMAKLQSKRGTNSLAVNFESFEDKLKYSISSARIKLSTKHFYYNDRDVVHVQDDDQYLSTGFFTLQHLIDLKYMAMKGSRTDEFDVAIASMPTIALEKIDSERVLNFGSFVVVLFNILLLVTFLVPMVEEKQDGIKEYLTIATQYSYYNGVAFFLTRSVIYIIFMIVSIVLGFTYKALGAATVVYVIILFLLYLISTMFYAYFISICFNSVFYTKVGGIVLLLTPYLFFLIDGHISNTTTFIFSTKTFLEAIRGIQVFTNKRSEFHYFFAPSGETYNSVLLMTMLVLQAVCYGLLYYYFSQIFPGRYGVKSSLNVFSKRNRSDNLLYQKLQNDLALKIQDLTKTYTIGSVRKRKKTVVAKLNMDIESKKITVLLGHNGAGKTTTINMILGLVTKTSGNITISNNDCVNTFRPIGYCPQHNVYMQYLTCAEHLQFFARLRGLSASKAKDRADELLYKLHLEDKANVYGKHLSGGMKRRLCLGMAIVGDTTLVILDEPSSGLDIESRRLLWDILLDLRKSTAILITTHHMEEADVLGDRISILMNGTLQSTGTSMELKRSSNCGFILKLLIRKPSDRYKILNEIQKIIPYSYIRSFVDPTVSIHLPYGDLPNYEGMLKILETKSEEFGILHIGLSDSTLNDVFLKKHDVEIKCEDELDGPLKRFKSKEYSQLKPNILKAIFYKKLIFIKREWKYFIFMMLIPFITTILALSIVSSAGSSSDLEKLSLNLNHLKRSTVYLKSDQKSSALHTALENEIRKCQGVPMNIKGPTINFLLDLQKQNLPHFYDTVVGAIDIHEKDDGSSEISIYFSGNIIHSSTVLLNIVDNALMIAGDGIRSSIEAQYLPIQQILDINPHRLEYYAGIIPIGMFFYIMYYVSLPFKEEKVKFKYLQGNSKLKYWLSFFTFDLIHHSLICSLIFALHKILFPQNMYNTDDLLVITSSIFFYGFAYFPILYFMATGFRSMSTLTTYLFFMLIVSSIAPLITSGSTQSMVKFEEWILVLNFLPDFALNHQMRIINENFFIKRRTKLMQNNQEIDNKPIMSLLNHSVFYCYEVFIFLIFGCLFVFVWENLYRRQKLINLFKFYYCRRVKKDCCRNSVQNDEVDREKKIVCDISDENLKDFPLVVKGLEKCYTRGKNVVEDLSFSVRQGECFGLLGVNGAGKTTTFQMLTANESITGGKVSIDGVDIVKEATEYKQKFGYCPQTDSLNNFMSSYEVLKYIGLLRGISCSEIDAEVDGWLKNLDLKDYKDMQIRYYSGGTKRKLNAAIAMIGAPSLIMLDEPTTGVDPISRRFLWDCIEKFKNDGKTIVLTSHSMDECEHLCNRLAIMANGEFQCLGHIPKLKADFGQGFTINFRIYQNISDEDKRTFENNMINEFDDCKLREHHAGLYTYFVASKSITWSHVFSKLYTFCKRHEEYIDVFSINETSLEDIFLEFEKKSQQNAKNCSRREIETV